MSKYTVKFDEKQRLWVVASTDKDDWLEYVLPHYPNDDELESICIELGIQNKKNRELRNDINPI